MAVDLRFRCLPASSVGRTVSLVLVGWRWYSLVVGHARAIRGPAELPRSCWSQALRREGSSTPGGWAGWLGRGGPGRTRAGLGLRVGPLSLLANGREAAACRR